MKRYHIIKGRITMSKFKRITSITLILFILIGLFHIDTISAAIVEINKDKLNMMVGDKVSLCITGTSKKVTWSSSNEDVAIVSSKGIVTAFTSGKATITGNIDSQKYTCKINVKEDKTVTVTVLNLLSSTISDYLFSLDDIEIVEKDDYVTTYTLKQSTQKLILTYLRKLICTISLSDLPSYYTDFKVSKDFCKVQLTLDKDEYLKNADSDYTALTFFFICYGYQQFEGLNDEDIKFSIRLIDQTTGTVFDSYDSSDLTNEN
jgi:hypothetical protein